MADGAKSDPADQCRRLLRAADRAVLSTLLADGGEPYGSLVLLACGPDGAPLLFLSDLADHTKNLKADARASLLIDGTAGLADPLTGARAGIQGRIEKTDDPYLLDRYVRRHPSASLYRGFKDFNLYRMEPDRAHLVAGFGRIHWTDGILFSGDTQTLVEAEASIVEHMNDDHLDAIALYANRLLGLSGVGWRMTGVDPEGCDIRRQGQTARIPFGEPVHDAQAARVELVRLVKQARAGE
ncbi:MAG: DUF2470 domain-containing protein [Alphaproteobacteria bacterium]